MKCNLHEMRELTQDWGNRLWEGKNKTLCTPGPSRKEQWPHKRLTQTCPWVSRSLWQRCGSVLAWCRIGATECSNVCMETFEGGCHYLHCLHHSLASGQTTGKEHSPTLQQKIGLKILTVWITINCGKFWKRREYQTTWSASWEICMQVRKQQLELDMEQ